MLKRFVHTVVRKRHFWRDITFDELAEIYISMTMRTFGFGIIGIFVPVYLFTSGVSLEGIFLFYCLFFLFRIPLSFITGYIIGRIGPKHAIAVSTIITITFLGMLISYSQIGWPLAILAFPFTFANSLFYVAYNIDFSKVAHSEHGGKELGWLYVFERLGGTLGPLVGGFIASFWLPEISIALAMLILLASLVPLFMTKEPVKVHQHVSYKKFPLKKHFRDFTSINSLAVQNQANIVVWPLFIAVVVFTSNTYAKLGAVFAVSTLVSMFCAHMYGKYIDKNKGRYLLNYGTFMNAVMNLIRASVSAVGGVVAISTLGEPVILSYRMPLYKGFFDAGNDNESQRVAYYSWVEALTAVAKGLFFVALLLMAHLFDPEFALRAAFVIAALVGFGMLSQRFKALAK